MNGFGDQYKSKNKATKKINLSKDQIINRAFDCHSRGEIQEAAKYYQFFINQGFKDYRVFINYGIILNTLGKPREAETFLRNGIELKPDVAEAYFNLGNILLNQGKLKEAETSLRKAIELNPKYAMAYCSLGSALINLEKSLEAEKFLRKAIELDPNLAESHLNLGTLLNKIDNFLDAEVSIRKAIELKPNFAEAHLNLGSILRNLGKLQDAELSTLKAIELKPNYVNAFLNLSRIFIDQGKSKEAELQLLKAIELNPQYGMSYFHLSNFYSSEKDNLKAHKFISLAMKYDPNNHLIQGEFTRLNFLLRSYEEEISENKVLWSDSDDYYYEDNDSDILLISFASNGRGEDSIPSFNFYQLLKNNKSFDKLFLRDIDRNYYLTGLKNSSKNLKETIDLIKKLISVKKYRKIVSIGSSAGGYAAILFGQLLNFSKVIAFNPQTVLSEEKESIIEDYYYTVDRCKELRNLNLSDTFYQDCLNLKNLVPFKTEVDIHVSNLSEVDKNYANFIEHKNCKLVKYNTSTHLLAFQLRESNKLKEIIEDNLLT